MIYADDDDDDDMTAEGLSKEQSILAGGCFLAMAAFLACVVAGEIGSVLIGYFKAIV